MIDFDAATFVKLGHIDSAEGFALVEPILIADETIFAAFRSIRDTIVFTNKRVIAINVEGITGKKKDFTSLPYSKIQAWSAQTASLLGFDTEMVLWFAGLGQAKFEFKGKFDITTFNKLIGEYIL
jgi:hypothetical protein